MTEPTQEYLNSLQESVAAWLELSIRELIQSAKGKNINVTQQTINSIVGSFSGLDEKGVGDAIISFQNSGRFLDWRSRQDWQKFPPIEDLAKWILKLGISKFKYIPGYNKSRRAPVPQMAARRIAWGVAMHRYQMGSGRKRPWFAKLFYKRHMAILIDRMVQATGTASIRVITENFENKNG
jgi:hypothetical protein